ncbi:MAG TPA: VIT domain-containing protein, partial [Lacunisphaera sp.]|nr:VIT domain-containing protein [Lacunisphaera sp.]
PWTTLGVELTTRICRDGFFDPLPTYWHVVAVALVGAGNLVGLLTVTRSRPSRGQAHWAGVLNGVALGVAAFFALWFLPVMPFALLGILVFGLGFLPLSPTCAVVVGLILRQAGGRQARQAGWPLPRVWPWALAAVAGLAALELPGAIEGWAVKAIADREGERQETALGILRRLGNEEQLLRGCYDHRLRRSHPLDLRAWLASGASPENYREAYYRVTGRPYSHRPPPDGVLAGPGQDRAEREWVWDEGLGGETVSERMKALYLTESRLDGKVEADAAVGYLEWTLVFRNDHVFQQREARALVQLPAGAVVSRLTLWINGEEREAAFGGRSQVRQAYQAVVNQRRDPVLVTAKGPDRVLVQCFPVEPGGKEMKIRLGITLPLVPHGTDSARFALPRVLEQNFSAVPGLAHAVWIESSRELSSAQEVYRAGTPRAGRHVLRGSLTPAQFGSFSSGMTVRRDALETSFWAADPRDERRVVTQEFVRQPPRSGALSIVLDGSDGLGPVAAVLAEAVEKLPAAFAVRLQVAGAGVRACPSTDPRAAAAWLRQQEFVGGQDATAALGTAVDALGAEGGTVLWIHGAQPVTWMNPTALEQSLTRRRG